LSGIVVAIAIVMAGAGYFISSSGGTVATLPSLRLKLTSWDRSMGSPNAPIQVVEYGAPSCPVCAYWNKTVFPAFKKDYVDTGKVYYTFRTFPLRPLDDAVEAMARCLPKERYFDFIHMMFENQSEWDPDGHQIADIQAALYVMGDKAGMSAVEVAHCTKDQAQLTKISAVGEHAQTAFHVNSTPSFFVDGAFHQQDFMRPDGMHKVLDAALKKANP
jgi:protein-disulfide isomerase